MYRRTMILNSNRIFKLSLSKKNCTHIRNSSSVYIYIYVCVCVWVGCVYALVCVCVCVCVRAGVYTSTLKVQCFSYLYAEKPLGIYLKNHKNFIT